MSNSNIVVEWLKSLHLGQYAESFIDNGYDDLEICKQVGDPDLDAIGVISLSHRNRLLQSIRTLREEGAASVYFTLEETAAVHDECHCDKSSIQSTGSSSCHQEFSEKERYNCKRYGGNTPESSGESSHEGSKFLDEYEEGKAELVKIPRIQLKLLLKEKLGQDGIRLHAQPYSTPCGERGFLEGLASRYADLFNTHYVDVLEYLDELRRYELDRLSTNVQCIGSIGSTQQTLPQESQVYSGLPTSLSQPIYIPGKYSPSSCLSDREEDEIYGFGCGANNKQIKHQLQTENRKPQRNCEGCLSPRSVYFYEFPPVGKCVDQGACGYHNNKKKSLSRFLRGLKNSHRKERHTPKQEQANTCLASQAAALNASCSSTSTHVDSETFNSARSFTENGNRFEETIQQLKLQEMIRKREEFNKDHEKMLQDIRQGLLHTRRGDSSVPGEDSIYMYDDEAYFNSSGQHWYDEPPYESDPEDFLMESNSSYPVLPTKMQNGRISFTLNFRTETLGDDTISLPLAGDISLPHDSSNAQLLCHSHRMISALDYTKKEYSAAQIRTAPIASDTSVTNISRRRIIEDSASSEILNIGSRLSNLLVKTLSSEQMDNLVTSSQRYLQSHSVDLRNLPSPLYALPCDTKTKGAQSALEFSCETSEKKPVSFIDRMRGLRQDVQRKLFHLRGSATSQSAENFCDETFSPTSSDGSIPNESGLSFQAVVHNDIVNSYSSSARNMTASPGRSPRRKVSPVIGKAKALVDYTPSPYDKDALKFKKGDIIDIIAMNPSGLWKGMLHNSIGTFKFINVEILADRHHKVDEKYHQAFTSPSQCKPKSVEELLRRLNMEDHISLFFLNGYETIDSLKELAEEDLDYLNIFNPEHRAKILAAIDFLHDYDSIHCVEGPYNEAVQNGGNASSSDQYPDDVAPHHLHYLNESFNCTVKDSASSQHHQHFRHVHNSHVSLEKSSVLEKPNSRYSHRSCKNTPRLLYEECSNGDIDKSGVCCINGSSNSCNFDITQDPQLQTFSMDNITETDILETLQDRSILSVNESVRNTVPISEFENPISEFDEQCFYPDISVKATTSSVHSDLPILNQHVTVSNSQDQISLNSYSAKKGKHISVDSSRSDVKASDLTVRNTTFGSSRTHGILRKCKQTAANKFVAEKNPDISTADREVISSSPSETVESFCESNRKANSSKYAICGNSDILSYDNATFCLNNVRGCSYSEKSSDSGVSSSSLSSTNLKENYSRKDYKGGHVIPSAISSTETSKKLKCLNNKKSPPPTNKTHDTCLSDL